ncbi:MAG: hypothetical protein ACJ8E7_02440, partial [Sphingomicrobium sp.]
MKPRFLAAASAFALLSLPAAAMAQHAGHPGMSMPMPQPEQKPQAPAPKPEAAPAEEHMHEQHAVERPPAPAPEPMDHGAMDHGAHQMAMTGALGRYPMAREASGTSWQPDASDHGGLHLMSGDWTLMAHGELNLVHSWQEKPRGDSKSFVAGMLMGMARR